MFIYCSDGYLEKLLFHFLYLSSLEISIFYKLKVAVIAGTSFVYPFFIDHGTVLLVIQYIKSCFLSGFLHEKSCFIYFVWFPNYLKHERKSNTLSQLETEGLNFLFTSVCMTQADITKT